jgi:hypothetical protein
VLYEDLRGDTWTPTWADNDEVYSLACDTRGSTAHPFSANLALYRITGTPPKIEVEVVNELRQFGHSDELRPEDGACWKGTGLICVDGVLYLALARNRYMRDPGALDIQQVWDASIIKSLDYGKTWSPAPQLGQAMFPGHTFSNPAFIQTGKDGRGGRAGDDQYVYAISNDGAWNNGNSMVLGRVRRDRIGRLAAADWEFVHGLDKGGAPIWRRRHDSALYVFRAPGQTGVAGVHYLAGLDRYLLPQWHYPSLNRLPRTVDWSRSQFELFEAPNPWGPWTLFHRQDFNGEGFYNPTIPSKFVSADGKRFWFFCAGDFSTKDQHLYSINQIPVSLTA